MTTTPTTTDDAADSSRSGGSTSAERTANARALLVSLKLTPCVREDCPRRSLGAICQAGHAQNSAPR
jgi:hypothetical protein